MARNTIHGQGRLFDGGDHAEPVLVSALARHPLPLAWTQAEEAGRTCRATAAAVCPCAGLS